MRNTPRLSVTLEIGKYFGIWVCLPTDGDGTVFLEVANRYLEFT